jgi:hypothetical protein
MRAIVEKPNGVVAKLGGGSHRWSQEGPPRASHRILGVGFVWWHFRTTRQRR